METEIGRVVEARDGRARIEVSRSSMCAHCSATKNGASASCVPAFGARRIIEVADPLGVSVNQCVRIELSGGELVWASLLAYIVPLTTFFAGAIVGLYGSESFRGDLWGGIGAVAGLAVGFTVSRWLGRFFGKQGKLTPTITAIVPSEDVKRPKK
ncbi:SoxR reducing system RseC family protein [Candidatus Poribacteria bacterium]|nr:SoxR reducing system RseC family protein [Candidatus Poribacteria bacterium]